MCLETRKKNMFHFPSDPAYLTVRNANSSSGTTEKFTLEALLREKCQSLFTTFKPKWYLFNGHLQTIYNSMGDFSKVDRMMYLRKLLRLPDGGTIGLDFAPLDFSSYPPETPFIVVGHGLTGGSYESYLRCVIAPATAPKEKGGLGYRAVVVTFRGCAGVPITSPRLYSAGQTDDLRQALMYLAHEFPKAPLLGIGFSMGANIMTKYIAEDHGHCRLNSMVALSCPWDLKANSESIHSTWIGNVYSKAMGTNLVRLVQRNEHHFRKFPDSPLYKQLDATISLKSATFLEFDDVFTRQIGGDPPIFPFATTDDYYRWGSSNHCLGDITVPFLSITADDDPVVSSVPMDGAGNGLVVMLLTKGGGHLGWFQDAGEKSINRWTTKPVLEWLELMAAEVVHPESQCRKTYKDSEGWIREEGMHDHGCKEVEGERVIDGNGDLGLLQGL